MTGKLVLGGSVIAVCLLAYSRRDDLEAMLVELLAYVGDQIAYYQDRVAGEAYLGTARPRGSIRRHGRLVDYKPRPAAS